MSSQKGSPTRQTLTYFGPLKDENNSKSSNVLQMVYKFFNLKRGIKEDQKAIADGNDKNDATSIPRPNVLDFAAHKQGSKRKLPSQSHDPGSEVELRLRSLSSMLKDFPKLMKGGNDQAESNGTRSHDISPNPSSSELRQYWMPDEQCHECYECGERFTTFRRRHHCRICGQIFCSRCCNQLISGEFMGYSGMLRSCTYCCKWVITFAQGNATKVLPSNIHHSVTSPNFEIIHDDSARDLTAASDSLLSHMNNGFMTGNGMSVLQSTSNTSLRRHSQSSGKFRHDLHSGEESQFFPTGITPQVTSPGRDLYGRKAPMYIFDATPDLAGPPVPGEDQTTALIQDSSQLHNLWRKINDEKNGIEFRDHRLRLRKYASCITGQELVDWLVRNDVTSTRAQACAIGQALYDGKWLKAVTDTGGVFQDGYLLFQKGKKPTPSIVGNKIEIFPNHFANAPSDEPDGESIYTLTEQEPIWVQEIKCEDEDDTDANDEFYDAFTDSEQTDGPRTFDDSLIYSDDEKSISEKSVLSLSSFVEIDEDREMIKYTRPHGNMSSQSRTVYSPQPGFEDSCYTSISADYLRSFLNWNSNFLNQPWIAPSRGWRETNLQSVFLHSRDKRAYQWLREIYLHHSLSFLKQILHNKGLDLAWAEILVPLAKHAAESVSPNPDVNIDVCHYVQIKKLLDGPQTDSQVLNGVVCTKNVVHKQMRTDICDPAILLLAIPLEYQRVQLKLSTLDPIVRQEREFYKHLISRITARKPHVVLVQCTVSHIAQKLLLEAGITLVINVKPSVMERVARSTEADIVYSIDQLLQAKLGTCSRFFIKHHAANAPNMCQRVNEFYESSIKTLMYFDGCKPVHGCTILLRGTTQGKRGVHSYQRATYELMQVQEVLRFLVQAMYHARLEITYLIDHQEIGTLLKKQNDSKQTLGRKAESILRDTLNSESGVNHGGAFPHITSNKIDDPSGFALDRDSLSGPPFFDTSTPTQSGVFNFQDSPNHCDATTSSPSSKKQPILVPLAPPQEDTSGKVPGEVTSNKQSTFDINCASFQLLLNNAVLSTSAPVSPKIPFLFTPTGQRSTMHQYLPEKLFWSRKMDRSKTVNSQNVDTDHLKEKLGYRSRSSTMESLVQEKLWLTPPHHKVNNGSAEYEDSTISLDTLGNSVSSRDSQEEVMSTPINRNRSEPLSYYSQHYKYHRREMILSSSDSVSSSNTNVRLHSWEQKLMDQVFGVSPPLTDKRDKLVSVSSMSSIPSGSQATSGPNKSSEANTSRHLRSEGNLSLGGNEEAAGVNQLQGTKEKEEMNSSLHDFISEPLTQPASSNKTRNLLADFRANIGSLNPEPSKLPTFRLVVETAEEETFSKSEDVMTEKEEPHDISFPFNALGSMASPASSPADCFDPVNHQHIHVLFSSYSNQSPNAPYHCVLPWVVDIDFYRGNDITVGGFLERYCFRPSYHCPNTTCHRPMVEHVRSFVHGNMCLTIVLKELSKPFQQSSIFTWNWDHVTKKSSEIKAMSHDVWSMSFAKYLELRLENLSIQRTSSSGDPAHGKQTTPDKDLELGEFTSFQYFLYRDIVAAFKCFPVSINEVVFPSPTLKHTRHVNTSFHTCQLTDDSHEDSTTMSYFTTTMKTLSEKTYEVLEMAHDCINTSHANRSSGTSDPPSEESQMARDRYFENLILNLNEDRCHLREDIDSIQLLLQSVHISASVSKDLDKLGAVTDLGGEDVPDAIQKDNCQISEEMSRNLSLRFLRLKCEISQLVQFWNQKFEEANEREKSGNWESKVYNVNNSPQTMKKILTNTSMSIPEENENLEIDEPSSNGLASISNSPGNRSLTASTEVDFTVPENRETNDFDKASLSSRPSFSRKPRQSLSLESKSSEKLSSYKRMSRTGSSVRLLVTRLLPGNALIPSIPLPFPADEHYLLPECVSTNVVVRDAEPASIIAYALSSEEYRKLLVKIQLESLTSVENQDIVWFNTDDNDSLSKEENSLPCRTSSQSISSTNSKTSAGQSLHDILGGETKSLDKAERREASDNTIVGSRGSPIHPTPTNSPHIELQFSDSTTKFYCKVYFASLFEKLRAKVIEGGEVQYLTSMSRSVKWLARGGKSGSTFHKTRDDQFIMKQMSYFELQSFLEFAPKYVNYVTESIDKQETTVLSKILGVYRVSFRNSETNRSMKQDVLVIENLFYQRKIGQIFDLKGSVRNRNVKVDASASATDDGCSAEHNDIVLLDENLLKLMCDNPLYVHEHTKHLLKDAIMRDTNFLSSNLIMDYSLLAGVDENNQIIVGIIDYIRTFTWDKKLEMVVKSYGMFGGRKTSNRSMPTVVSPELYKNRFCEAMDRYFQVVPDRWYGMHTY